MACEQYFSQGWKQVQASMTNSQKPKPCFDCCICLEFASEPIVTLCGHLYCWPCIYKWLHIQSASLASDEPPQCPVCKADISDTTMIPLYGHGQSSAQDSNTRCDTKTTVIPPRPSASSKALASIRSNTDSSSHQLRYQNPYQNHNYDFDSNDGYDDDSGAWLFDIERDPINGFRHPVVGMLGELVFGKMFGNEENLYAYRNSYSQSGSSRQEMQAEKKLNRIWIFLLCCFILCFIIF